MSFRTVEVLFHEISHIQAGLSLLLCLHLINMHTVPRGLLLCVLVYAWYCFTLKIPTWICDYQLHHSALISLQGLLYHYYKVVLSLERDITLCLMCLVCRVRQCKHFGIFPGHCLTYQYCNLMENSSRWCLTIARWLDQN